MVSKICGWKKKIKGSRGAEYTSRMARAAERLARKIASSTAGCMSRGGVAAATVASVPVVGVAAGVAAATAAAGAAPATVTAGVVAATATTVAIGVSAATVSASMAITTVAAGAAATSDAAGVIAASMAAATVTTGVAAALVAADAAPATDPAGVVAVNMAAATVAAGVAAATVAAGVAASTVAAAVVVLETVVAATAAVATSNIVGIVGISFVGPKSIFQAAAVAAAEIADALAAASLDRTESSGVRAAAAASSASLANELRPFSPVASQDATLSVKRSAGWAGSYKLSERLSVWPPLPLKQPLVAPPLPPPPLPPKATMLSVGRPVRSIPTSVGSGDDEGNGAKTLGMFAERGRRYGKRPIPGSE
jgi:hypothetical protein